MIKLIFFTILIPCFGFSQKILVKEDTLIYQHQKYFVGKELKIGQGSSKDHNFSYIFWGMNDEPANPIDIKWVNTIVEVEKIYELAGKFYLKCHRTGVINKFHVDLQDAFDNKEIN